MTRGIIELSLRLKIPQVLPVDRRTMRIKNISLVEDDI